MHQGRCSLPADEAGRISTDWRKMVTLYATDCWLLSCVLEVIGTHRLGQPEVGHPDVAVPVQ